MNRMVIALLGEGKVTFSKADHRDVTALISLESHWKRKEMRCSGKVRFGREMLGLALVKSGTD